MREAVRGRETMTVFIFPSVFFSCSENNKMRIYLQSEILKMELGSLEAFLLVAIFFADRVTFAKNESIEENFGNFYFSYSSNKAKLFSDLTKN